jgi:hypothetical protein
MRAGLKFLTSTSRSDAPDLPRSVAVFHAPQPYVVQCDDRWAHLADGESVAAQADRSARDPSLDSELALNAVKGQALAGRRVGQSLP